MQMIYWITTTISTVGYGDFSPTTVPSRHRVEVMPRGKLLSMLIQPADVQCLDIYREEMQGRVANLANAANLSCSPSRSLSLRHQFHCCQQLWFFVIPILPVLLTKPTNSTCRLRKRIHGPNRCNVYNTKCKAASWVSSWQVPERFEGL